MQEVWHERFVVKMVLQFIAKVFVGVEVKILCRPSEFLHSHSWQTRSLSTAVISCWNRFGLGHIVPRNHNAISYKDIIDYPTSCQLFGEVGDGKVWRCVWPYSVSGYFGLYVKSSAEIQTIGLTNRL